jgi:hypothetical protein
MKRTADLLEIFFEQFIEEKQNDPSLKSVTEFYEDNIDIHLFEDEVRRFLRFVRTEICSAFTPIKMRN